MAIDGLAVFGVMKLILVVTVGIGLTGGILAWKERPKPGAGPLVLLLAGQCWWSATLFFQMNATGVQTKMAWVALSWLGIVVIPVAWLLFSLEYTGYSQYVRPRYVALVAIIPVMTAVFSLTNDYHNLLYAGSRLVEQGGNLMLEKNPGPWYWVIAAYTYLLGLLGAIPLLQFVSSDSATFRGQSLAILIGLSAPWVTNVFFLLGALPTGEIDPTPVAFSVSGVAYLGALMRFQLFGTSPTPIRQARFGIFERMEDGAVVLDTQNHIVDMNRQAAKALLTTPRDAVGRPVDELIRNFDSVLRDQSQSVQTVLHTEEGEQPYDVSINELEDIHGRITGRLVTLHDIRDYLRQQQRLEVLNRVFRHNVRTNTQIIVGNADYLSTHNSERRANKVRENALEIEEISEKIRTVLDVFERSRMETRSVPLDAVLRNSVSTVREEHPEVTFEYSVGSDTAFVDGVIDDVILNVVENAAQHNTDPDPRVWIEVESDGDNVRITVADNGPGIDDTELSLLEQGTETPLKHGSGFGLALIVWGTEIVGGEVTFEENDPTGLVVTIEVPVLSRSDGDPEFDQIENRRASRTAR